MLRLYNTLSSRKEPFAPLGGEIKIYTCGPTVYDYAHIGNFRAYIFQDLLRRYLRFWGYKLRQVMNLTDVDDKTIRGSREEGLPLKEYTSRYERAFFEDLKTMNMHRAEFYPRATEHIKLMVKIIKKLLEEGYAYYAEDGSVYFDISEFKGYGKLSGVNIEGLREGARVKQDDYAKGNARDFALWKAYSREDGEVYWDTELGRGRPGWHIECSAMSMHYLGETLDIHAGGIDLVFPHHENEIAQSEAYTGKPFASFWVHNEHLLVEGKKMSKSLGNFYTLRELLERGYSAMAIRYLLLATHYRKRLNFTFRALEDAYRTVRRLEELRENFESARPGERNYLQDELKASRKAFLSALDDDLDTPMALSALFHLVRQANRALEKERIGGSDIEGIRNFLSDFNFIFAVLREKRSLPWEFKKLIREREEAREGKDFETADRIREYLYERGIVLEDTPRGTKWKWR